MYKKTFICLLLLCSILSCKPQKTKASNNSATLDGLTAREWFIKGNQTFKQKDYEAALDNYSKAIKLNPTDARYYNNRGTVYQLQQNYLAATSDYTKATELNPKFAQAYRNRGTAYLDQKMYKFAIADWEQACKLGLSAMCDYLKYHKVSSSDDF